MEMSRRQWLGATLALSAAAITPLRASEVRAWDHSVDVLVAGSGAAGIAAAIEARRSGLDVLVVESQAAPGGSTALSGGVIYLGGGTALQKALGIDDSVEAMAAFISAAGAAHPQQDKIDLYCESSVAHFDWLVANGVPYNARFSASKERPEEAASLFYSGGERSYPFNTLAAPAPRGHVPAVVGRGGGRLITALTAAATAQRVKLLTGTAIERLIVESDGRVSGAALRHAGTLRHVRAHRGVVLACGGFIHNRAMTARYAPVLHECVPLAGAGDLGTGIRLAQGLGAEALRMHEGFAILPLYPPYQLLRGIIVNTLGQRFVAEDAYYGLIGHHIAYRQGGSAYLIADSDSALVAGDTKFPVHARAATVAELAAALQLAPGALDATVALYNREAGRGRDPLLHKAAEYLAPLQAPPFTAYDLSVGSTYFPAHTFGGLHTNTDSQVIHADGAPIPGLYAAGRSARGLPSAPYFASGLSLGDATFFGRRAGRHLARRA